MTPKTQAEILVDEYYQLLGEHIFNGHFDLAKECALITVNKLIEEFDCECSTSIYYFNEVKTEIEKL
jgi:hypothetical protein